MPGPTRSARRGVAHAAAPASFRRRRARLRPSTADYEGCAPWPPPMAANADRTSRTSCVASTAQECSDEETQTQCDQDARERVLFDRALEGIGGIVGAGLRAPSRLARFARRLVQPIVDRVD